MENGSVHWPDGISRGIREGGPVISKRGKVSSIVPSVKGATRYAVRFESFNALRIDPPVCSD